MSFSQISITMPYHLILSLLVFKNLRFTNTVQHILLFPESWRYSVRLRWSLMLFCNQKACNTVFTSLSSLVYNVVGLRFKGHQCFPPTFLSLNNVVYPFKGTWSPIAFNKLNVWSSLSQSVSNFWEHAYECNIYWPALSVLNFRGYFGCVAIHACCIARLITSLFFLLQTLLSSTFPTKL